MSKSILIHENGGPEKMRLEEVEVGSPGPGQVKIRQTAVGLNFIDIHHRTGRYPSTRFPIVLGMEAAIADINKHHADAAFAVVSGDLTHWGEPQSYANFSEAMSALKMPYIAMVGNHDRRVACPAANTHEATNAGIALDQSNPNYSGSLPPYGASNYCVNASVQFYNATLTPFGHNIRLTQHSWDPQLNAPHTGSASNSSTFIGDYFGNTTSGSTNISSFVSTYNDGSNPNNQQQQVIDWQENEGEEPPGG